MLLRIGATAIACALLFAAPASAQTVPTGPVIREGTIRPGSTGDMIRDQTAERAAASDRAARQPRGRARPPSPAETEARAREVIAELGLQCTVGEAVTAGRSADDKLVLEVSCVDAPGYLLAAATPPQAFNCLALDVSIANGGDPSSGCSMPANKDAVAATRGYARALGVGCTVDEAAWIGRTPEDHDRYEVGCADAEGYWLEIANSGAPVRKIECLELVRAGRTCGFTTSAEQISTLSGRLAGTEAASCSVTAVRYAGGTAAHRYYEVACEGGDGVIARFGLDGVFDRKFDCAGAANVLGGCILGRPATGD